MCYDLRTLLLLCHKVIYGGHMDIDVDIKMQPRHGRQETLFHEQKSETGSHTFTAKQVRSWSCVAVCLTA